MINELRSTVFKKSTQTLLYLPHFMSWIVLGGIVQNFLSVNTGPVNDDLIDAMGGRRINFLGSEEWFRFVIVITSIWKEAGWGTIIYLAALSSVNPDLYEAATVDGANRWQKILHVTLPGIASTIVITLVLAIGGMMNNGFEQVYLFQNDLNLSVSEVFETYTYKIGIVSGRYLSTTATVGLLKNVIGTILIFSADLILR